MLTILTKHQAWARSAPMFVVIPKSGLPGSSCASVLLPMAWQQTKMCKIRMVKSSNLRNSHTRHLNAFYCILLILPLWWLTYHVVSSEMKRTSSNSPQICMMDLAHLSTNPLYGPPFTQFTIAPSICSVSIPTAVPLLHSWLVPHHRHHPHQTPSLGPGITNLAEITQSQVCQGWVVLQSLCQCLTAGKSLKGKIPRTQGQLSKCWNSRAVVIVSKTFVMVCNAPCHHV